ncbi:hypothetical protein [Shewanella sp. NIFS-20-20]|uniref:hypothetical protein n=1 Tax=Shewanella sp. NIFS-20-20 TaxID=2853806 RepID=UPI001C46B2DE|nr:hypothetical protein [Shewanella sp. NIFS-20-20]MBV7317454.1 hypothetical protein [Shewanella sp. NIFS-20-20]
MFKKSIVTLALTALWAGQAVAGYPADVKKLGTGFLDDSKSYIQFKVQNYNYDHRFQDGKSQIDNETPLYIEYGFSSGYYDDWIGVDVAPMLVTMVDWASDYREGTDRYGLGNTLPDGETYANLGVAYLKTKFKLGDAGTLKAGFGKKRRYTTLFNEKVIRVNESSTHGYDLSYENSGNELFVSYIDGFQNFGQADYITDITDWQGNRIDYMLLTGLNGKVSNINYKFEYAESKNYIRRVLYQADFTSEALNTNFMLRGTNVLGVGEQFTDVGKEITDDGKSGLLHLVTTTQFGNGTTMNIKATKVYDGDVVQDWGHGATMSRPMLQNTMLGNEVPLIEGEEALMLRFAQNFDGLLWKGLSGYAQFWKGWNAKNVTGYHRQEYVLELKQDFGKLHPALDGLSLQYTYMHHDGRGADNGYREGRVNNVYGFLTDDIYRKLTLQYRLVF